MSCIIVGKFATVSLLQTRLNFAMAFSSTSAHVIDARYIDAGGEWVYFICSVVSSESAKEERK